MNERWVCKRCFADNDEADGACARGGLTRGAEAPAGEIGRWTAAMSTSVERPGWRRWLRFWWVPALAIFLVVGYLASARRDGGGAITAGGSLSVTELRVGDCFISEDAEEISTVEARPCDEPHQYELFHVATWTGSDVYPSIDAQTSFLITECGPVFETYVGRSYETSSLDFFPFTPTEEGWEHGDRTFQCVLVDPARTELTSSLRSVDR